MLVISILIVVGIPRVITNFQTESSVIFLNFISFLFGDKFLYCNSLFVSDKFSSLFCFYLFVGNPNSLIKQNVVCPCLFAICVGDLGTHETVCGSS